MTNLELIEEFADVKRYKEGARMSISPRPETVEKWARVAEEVLDLFRERDVNAVEAYFVAEYLVDSLRHGLNLPEATLRKEKLTQ
ncbi:MAG: hypothetical protein J2P13_11595 [Acidobacteria bacterium]|nr:hypothetical protein [Acidobacteriota bacterium]